MKKIKYIIVIIMFLLVSANIVHAQQNGVAVIAPSSSTMREAREVLKRLGWVEVSIKQADYVLVVCSSNLSYPLNSMYSNISALDKDANFWLTLSSRRFHVYLYMIKNDLSVTEVEHINYPAD